MKDKKILYLIIILLFLTAVPFNLTSAQEVSALKESYVYKPRFLSAELIKENLNISGLNVKIINNKNYLLLQGTEKQVEEAQAALDKIDNRENPYQIKYTLKIIDLQSEKKQGIDLISAELDSGNETSFLAEEKILELSESEFISSLKAKTAQENVISERVAKPTLVTVLGQKGSLSFGEEYFGLEEDIVDSEATSLEVNLTPRKIDREQKVKTDVEITVNETRELNTTSWIKSREDSFLGVMTLTQKKKSDSIFSKKEKKVKRNFAVYMKAEFVGLGNSYKANKTKVSASLAGADQLLLSSIRNNSQSSNNSLQILYESRNNLKFNLNHEISKTSITTDLQGNIKEEFFVLGVNYPIRKELKLGGYLINQTRNGLSLGAALSDSVKLGSNIRLDAGYFPLLYSFSNNEITSDQFFLEAEYNPGSFFIKAEYASDFKPYELSLETGIAVKSSLYLVVSVNRDSSGLNYYSTGIKLNY